MPQEQWPESRRYRAFRRGVQVAKWFLDFIGTRAIWNRIQPPPDSSGKRPPKTFFLWLVGIYVVLFGVASQRYENRVNIIENRSNSIFAQLATPAYKKALGRISRVQRMSCPAKPDIKSPASVIHSLLYDSTYTGMVLQLKETVEDWKDSLNAVDLRGIYLPEANLSGANLHRANLEGADLREAILFGADLGGANLGRADLREAYLLVADLRGADLREANLNAVDLREADLEGANLEGADLRACKNLTAGQLCETKTLIGTLLDLVPAEQVEEECPHLWR